MSEERGMVMIESRIRKLTLDLSTLGELLDEGGAHILEQLLRDYMATEIEFLKDLIPRIKPSIRPRLVWFSEIMEEKLRANDHKGGWSEASLLWLPAKLDEEIGELSEHVLALYTPDGQVGRCDYIDAQDAEREAADVANIAMMIADRIGDLVTFDTCERKEK